VFLQPPGQQPEAGEGGQEDREAGRVMPFAYQLDPGVGGAPGQDERAHHIQTEGDDHAAANQGQPVGPAQPVEFAEKQSAHNHGLEGANATAGFIDADYTGADLDDVAVLGSQDVHPAEHNDRQRGHAMHQTLRQPVFDPGRPRDRHEDEADREGEMTEPWGRDVGTTPIESRK
jgi:hypothetical protein